MAGIIVKSAIDQVRAASDIVDVVGSYLNLKRAGTTFKALCPFHKEKTPSFNVHPQRQIFHCFGCGAGGDVFKFVMQYENVDFGTAVRMLADRAGIRLEFERGSERDDGPDKDALYRLHEEAARWFQRMLTEHAAAGPARAYLESRQLAGDAARDFRLGYAPSGYENLVRWAAGAGFPPALVEASGLASRRDDGSLYDRFRDRLMFPIRDELGRVIAFSGRILVRSDDAAKYVNSPETPLFRKGKVLYALDRAKRAILDTRVALVCEGQIDVIRCHLAGLTHAVAGQGTALTEDQARLARRYADEVVLLLDADEAGQNAAIRSAEVFMAAGLAVRVGALPPGEDPDSLILTRGGEAVRAIVDAAGPAVDFQVDTLLAREDGSEAGRLRVVRAVLETLGRIPEAVQRDGLLRRAAARLRVSEAALREDLNRRVAKTPPPRRDAAAAAPARPAHPREEVGLAGLLIHHPDQAEVVRRYLPLAHLVDPDCRTIVGRLLDLEAAGPERLAGALADAGEECQRLAAELLAAPPTISEREEQPQRAAQDYVRLLWRRQLDKQYAEVARRRAEAGPGDQELDQELKQLLLDLNGLKSGWDRAVGVIEMHL